MRLFSVRVNEWESCECALAGYNALWTVVIKITPQKKEKSCLKVGMGIVKVLTVLLLLSILLIDPVL